ncbi:hypothetical protein D7Y27_06710 [Corallococcus sp. AB004]|uniref:hypothetical protein n=1 Tax=Corallococcus sp. AB038B TaxID=2316718 RepID=UPI000EA2113C|nr:hypothetical protein [Corallococcus sp. AB038B]RKH99660.1 hypothetical protein D7Y04_21450 [Corallococcus sp. AB038B]RKI47359.1 hypothetical protein D7Y27_06710 [Corallococcus sp. AB004]
MPLLPAVVGVVLVTLAEAVSRTEELQRQSGALKRLFGRFPRETALAHSEARGAGAAPGEAAPKASRSLPGGPRS